MLSSKYVSGFAYSSHVHVFVNDFPAYADAPISDERSQNIDIRHEQWSPVCNVTCNILSTAMHILSEFAVRLDSYFLPAQQASSFVCEGDICTLKFKGR
jgi:hypothetical protein